MINRLIAKAGQHKTHYLFFDGGQDVVGGGVSLHAAASCAVADGQQKPLLRHWALLRSWHSSCVDTHTHNQTQRDDCNRRSSGGKKKQNLVHTSKLVYACTHTAFFSSTTPQYTQEDKRGVTFNGNTLPPLAKHKCTPTRTIWPEEEKGCQCFMSVTVQISAIWP